MIKEEIPNISELLSDISKETLVAKMNGHYFVILLIDENLINTLSKNTYF